MEIYGIGVEVIVSVFAIVISIVFGVVSYNTSRKANKLQTEVLKLSKEANEFEINKGEVLMMRLLGRYFIVQLNCWELNGKMKHDKLSINNYIRELEQLDLDFNTMISNRFYIEALKKYPEIDLLLILLRYSIHDRKENQTMAVNYNMFVKFYDLYYKIKDDVADVSIFDNQFYKSVDEATEFLKIQIPKLKPKDI